MTERVNIKVDKATRKRLKELKRENGTWDGLLLRAADALEAEQDRDIETVVRHAVRDELNKGESE